MGFEVYTSFLKNLLWAQLVAYGTYKNLLWTEKQGRGENKKIKEENSDAIHTEPRLTSCQ